MKQKKVTIKLYSFVIVVVILLFCLIMGKLSFVALSGKVDGLDLTAFAKSRNTVKKKLYANRGTIYDNKGEELAQTVNSYTLIAYLEKSRTSDESHPQHVVDKDLTASKLAPLLGLTKEEVLKYLNKKAYQVEFGLKGKNISELQKNAIAALALPGISFITSSTRYYKMGNFASYLIGYAKASDKGEITGEMGIEEYYNDYLKGSDGYTKYQKDAYGYQIPNTPSYTKAPTAGDDIYLTIDNNIQIIVENALKDLDKDFDFSWVTFNVMEAKTGAIVASATSPSFDLNNLNTISSYLNPLVSYQYEPGSTMKIFSFMAALENGIYNGEETYKSGSIEVADATIRDFNNVGWGTISYDTGFAYSSNVAATNLGLKLGTKKLHAFYEKLGFGQKTGIELPDEVVGNLTFNYKTELANASFGQGITTTPIQTLQALSVLTNKGTMIKPYLVKKIVDSKKNIVYEGKRTEVGEVVSQETIDKMQKLMYNVIYNGLTKSWQPNNVTILGKTGTAQIASAQGGYLKGDYDYVRSFAGIFPADDPQYILYVSVKQLNGTASNLAKLVTRVVEEIAKYSNLTETKSDLDASKIINLENYLNKDVELVKESLTNLGLNALILGNGSTIVNQYPLKEVTVIKGSKVFLKTNGIEITMPDITGWSSNEVISLCKLLKINYHLNGYGYVKSYSILAGSVIKSNMTLDIELAI